MSKKQEGHAVYSEAGRHIRARYRLKEKLEKKRLEEDEKIAAARSEEEKAEAYLEEYPIFEQFGHMQQEGLQSYPNTPVLGQMHKNDTALLNRWLRHPDVVDALPSEVRFVWSAKPIAESEVFQLLGIKTDPQGLPALDGDAIEKAAQDFSTDGKNTPLVSPAPPDSARTSSKTSLNAMASGLGHSLSSGEPPSKSSMLGNGAE